MEEVRKEELQRMSENELNIICLSFTTFRYYEDFEKIDYLFENSDDIIEIEEIRELNWIQLIFKLGIKYLSYNRNEIIDEIENKNKIEKKIIFLKMSKFELNKLLVAMYFSNKDEIIDDILDWEEIYIEDDDGFFEN